jgi:Protein of unknown function (DUF2971)
MQNHSCTRIYKYRSLSGKYGQEAIERALTRNQLYWQSPAEFNDPFDCIPVLYYGDNDAQRRNFVRRAAEKVYIREPRPARRQHRKDMNKVPATHMERSLRAAWDQWLLTSAVSCFSEVHDHPLMWGHYADSHKGVCLIFEEIANDQMQWFAFPVVYQKTRPRLNLTSFNNPDVAMQAMCLKSDHWSYEHEQRMIEWRVPPGYRDFPAQQLKGIILGAKIGADDEAFVRRLLVNRSELAVFRAEIDPAGFNLNMVPA